jgi:tRNA G18 (ribose-2'-O)-methylase SpoU
MKKEIYIILHNIRSAQNVGSIFRTADACGVSKIFLGGYSPLPIDRFGRERKDISKSSLGAEKTVAWEKYEDAGELIEKLKKEGVEIVSVEQDKKSVDYKNFKPIKNTAFVFGNEVGGVEKELLEISDKIIEIPMLGEKESLNVSVSAGIVLFRVLNI